MVHAVVPYGVSNSSVRTRIVHWFDRTGAGIVHGPGFNSSSVPIGEPTILLRNARRFTRGRVEQSLLREASLGIYELDDGLPWDDGTLPGLGRWYKRPWPRSVMADRAARGADRMIVGNQLLADWAAQRCDDVRIIPTCVEPADYVRKVDLQLSDRPTIGWIGSRATEPYLQSIGLALAEMHRRHGAVVEMISHAGPVPNELAGFTTLIPWSESLATTRLATWDIGVMPLIDGVYERAKCGYKLLQYAAAGLPSIGSPIGVNRSILQAMDAPMPTTADEWVDALDVMLAEGADRRSTRAQASIRVADSFSYDQWEPAWRSAVGLDQQGSCALSM